MFLSIGIVWFTDSPCCEFKFFVGDPSKTAAAVSVIRSQPSDINITLEEDAGTLQDGTRKFQMVPGATIEKDPKVTVTAGSEDCWLFVKVEKSSTLDTYISYAVDSKNWASVTGYEGVYYYIGNAEHGTEISILTDDQVTVKKTVTKADMTALEATDAIQPTLTFNAYAIQSANLTDAAGNAVTDPATAWSLAIAAD